jgi:subtilisin-like proprotein convertase family protein
MKKLFPVLLLVVVISILIFSCNKENPVTPTGGNSNTGSTYYSSYRNSGHVNLVSNGFTLDSIECTIPSDASVNAVVNVNLLLDSIEGVDVTKLSFTLVKDSVSVLAIDLLTRPGSSFIGTVLSDSATTPIDQGVSPYTGRFLPQQPLNAFVNKNPSGKWKLRVYNSGTARTGVIKSWSITITYRTVQEQIFPLAVGNYWISEQRDRLGNFMTYDTIKIPYTITFQGKTLYRLDLSNQSNSDTIYAYNEADGTYAGSFSNSVFQPQLMWKYPVNVGDMYMGGGNADSTFCRSVNETVPTPSGTYTGCIKYEAHDMGHISTIFYLKPGLGIVAEEHISNGIMIDYNKLFRYRLY